MNDSLKLILDLFAISGCIWLLFGLYICIRIERFIVKRYEEETDLLDTIYFKEHATFTKHIPDFFSSAMYTSHLLTFVWCWNYFKKKKPYRDIKEANYVTRHFSLKEIRQAKWFVLIGLIVTIHITAYYILKSISPAAFN